MVGSALNSAALAAPSGVLAAPVCAPTPERSDRYTSASMLMLMAWPTSAWVMPSVLWLPVQVNRVAYYAAVAASAPRIRVHTSTRQAVTSIGAVGVMVKWNIWRGAGFRRTAPSAPALRCCITWASSWRPRAVPGAYCPAPTTMSWPTVKARAPMAAVAAWAPLSSCSLTGPKSVPKRPSR